MAHMGKICCKVGVVSQGWYGGYGAPLTRCLETSGMAVPFWLTDSRPTDAVKRKMVAEP